MRRNEKYLLVVFQCISVTLLVRRDELTFFYGEATEQYNMNSSKCILSCQHLSKNSFEVSDSKLSTRCIMICSVYLSSHDEHYRIQGRVPSKITHNFLHSSSSITVNTSSLQCILSRILVFQTAQTSVSGFNIFTIKPIHFLSIAN